MYQRLLIGVIAFLVTQKIGPMGEKLPSRVESSSLKATAVRSSGGVIAVRSLIAFLSVAAESCPGSRG